MKKTVSFLSLLLYCPLVACNSYTTTADITYVIEEDPLSYTNYQYLPLLDIIQQFKDFHEEELETKNNTCPSKKGEELASTDWQTTNTLYNEMMSQFVADLEKDIMDLLQATTTINDYLANLANRQDLILAGKISATTKYLLDAKTSTKNRFLPTSKKLFDFFMEDKVSFGGCKAFNKSIRLRAITRFGLLSQLIQTAIDLTNRSDLNEKLIALLSEVQSIAACEHQDAIGGPYALLEDVILSTDLPSEKTRHRIALKRLLKFDKLKERCGSSTFLLAQLLFEGIYKHTDPLITHHVLGLIKDRTIKIWCCNTEPPKYLQYEEDAFGNIRITSPIQTTIEKPSHLPKTISKQEEQKAAWSTDKWLAYIEGPTKNQPTRHTPTANKKKTKQQRGSLTTTIPSTLGVGQQTHKSITTSLQRTQDSSYTRLQEKPTKKQIQKPKKPILSAPSIHNSLEYNKMPMAASLLNEKLTPTTSLQATSTTALSLLPTIEEQENIDHPTVSPTTISSTLTTQTASNNISLTLPNTIKEPTMDHLTPNVEKPVLLPISKPAKKQVPIKIVIVAKPAEQAASPEKEKTQQQAEEKTQQKEPIKKIASLENTSLVSQAAFPQGPIQANPQRHFIMPRGLRSFHAAQLQTAYPIIPYPKHQATINQLFNPACNITYKVFETLWIANGGNIMHKGGSHCTLQFPQGTNLFGIYKPHGASDTYGTKAIQYLRAAALYIGLRPEGWS